MSKHRVITSFIVGVILVTVYLTFFQNNSLFKNEVESLTVDPNGSYTLMNAVDTNTSLLLYMDINNKPKEYIKLDDLYTNILIHDSGFIIQGDNKTTCYKDEDNKYVLDTCIDIDISKLYTVKEEKFKKKVPGLTKQFLNVQDYNNLPYNFNFTQDKVYIGQTYEKLYNKNEYDGHYYNPVDFDIYNYHK